MGRNPDCCWKHANDFYSELHRQEVWRAFSYAGFRGHAFVSLVVTCALQLPQVQGSERRNEGNRF